MLVPLPEPYSQPLNDIFRLARIKTEENRKAIELRNKQMQETGPMEFYRSQLQKRKQQTDAMRRLRIEKESTVHLATTTQRSGALTPVQTLRSIYHQADVISLKELIENAVKKHLTRYQRPVIGLFVSHFNFLYLQLYNFNLAHITILENTSLDDCTIICLS